MPIGELLNEWHQVPRPLLIIDEIRPDDCTQPGRQFCIYTAVLTDTRTAVQIGSTGALLEHRLRGQDKARAFKGRHLFGARPSRRHEAVRGFLFSAMARCQATATLVTANDVLRADRSRIHGSINAEPALGETHRGSTIRGAELLLLMNMLKQIASDWWPAAEQVEVLVDRSRQLGLDPDSRQLSEDQFEVLGPDYLNTAPAGGPSEIQCASKFRIAAAPEDRLFADLLMLPDAVGYLRQMAGGHDAGCERIRAGESYWMKYEGTEPFRAEAERRGALAKVKAPPPL